LIAGEYQVFLGIFVDADGGGFTASHYTLGAPLVLKTASDDQDWRRLMIRPGSTRRGPNSQLVGSMPGSWIGHERGIPPSPRTVGWIAMGSWCG
jgi:hypothetical protein